MKKSRSRTIPGTISFDNKEAVSRLRRVSPYRLSRLRGHIEENNSEKPLYRTKFSSNMLTVNNPYGDMSEDANMGKWIYVNIQRFHSNVLTSSRNSFIPIEMFVPMCEDCGIPLTKV